MFRNSGICLLLSFYVQMPSSRSNFLPANLCGFLVSSSRFCPYTFFVIVPSIIISVIRDFLVPAQPCPYPPIHLLFSSDIFLAVCQLFHIWQYDTHSTPSKLFMCQQLKRILKSPSSFLFSTPSWLFTLYIRKYPPFYPHSISFWKAGKLSYPNFFLIPALD